MRALPVLCIALLAFIVSGATAVAKTVTVTITKNGYVPKSQSIVAGDTVTFTNSDTAAHQIDFKSTTGFTCASRALSNNRVHSGDVRRTRQRNSMVFNTAALRVARAMRR